LQTEIGYFYHKQGINSKALEYCKRGLELAQTIEVLYVQKNACQCLYETYKDMGKSNEALFFFEKMIVFKDSMYNDENTKKITRLEMQYDFDKKEAAALAEQEKKDALAKQELQRQKMVRNVFVGGFALVLIFAGIFFRQRNKISKEKERSESLLLNILPAEIADELKEKGSADARDFEMASILFSDFKGFTSASEKLSAQELVSKINTCFEAFDGIMEKYGIEKIKTIGDAYMAAGGLPVQTDDSVKNTVLAALEMQQFIWDHKNKMDATNKPAFEMRVGVHTGPVVAGIVGVKKFQYDIWGDTVNTASRMESAGEVNKVNISKATFEILKDDPEFTFESRGKIEAKGKGEIEMYFVSKA
jgi:class 3 adenylate cyclase